MAKVQYITCPKCTKDYYIDQIIFDLNQETVKLKCPFCKAEFYLDVNSYETKLESQ